MLCIPGLYVCGVLAPRLPRWGNCGKGSLFWGSQHSIDRCFRKPESICLDRLPTKTTATQNEVALSYHSVRGLYFLAVIFAAIICRFDLARTKEKKDGRKCIIIIIITKIISTQIEITFSYQRVCELYSLAVIFDNICALKFPMTPISPDTISRTYNIANWLGLLLTLAVPR